MTSILKLEEALVLLPQDGNPLYKLLPSRHDKGKCSMWKKGAWLSKHLTLWCVLSYFCLSRAGLKSHIRSYKSRSMFAYEVYTHNIRYKIRVEKRLWSMKREFTSNRIGLNTFKRNLICISPENRYTRDFVIGYSQSTEKGHLICTNLHQTTPLT